MTSNRKRKKIEFAINGDGCHVCTSHAINGGYPYAKINGKNIRLHRLIYTQTHGEIPASMIIRHKCDNTFCINPEHLEAGSHADNMRDMVSRGRSLSGLKNPRAILTEEMVKEILASNENQCALGRKYGVTNDTIHAIKKRKTWKHVVA